MLYNVTWGGVLAFLCYIICRLYVDLQTGGTEPTRGWQTHSLQWGWTEWGAAGWAGWAITHAKFRFGGTGRI